MDPIAVAAARVRDALRIEGRHPEEHRRQVERLRLEWPTLWETVDELARVVDDTPLGVR